MSLVGILLGLLDIAVFVAVLLLVGAIIMWILTAISWPPPVNVQKGYIAVVALIALVMIVSLLLGAPRIHIFTTVSTAPAIISAV